MKQPFIHIYLIFLVTCCTVSSFAQEYNMSNNTVTDCEGTLYDSGGPDGNYGIDESFTFTICPTPSPTCIRLDFGTVVVENNFDAIRVFDGSSDTDPSLLFHNGGLETIGIIEATSGCATITFVSDETTTFSGWEMNWACFDEDCPEIQFPPNEQDCIGAIPLCLGEYSETNSFVGEGSIVDEINPANSCLGNGERNSVWYTFTVLQSGDLGFTITPNDLSDDYDWAVFNISNASCEDIFSDATLSVSCNYSFDTGVTGPTGATGQDEGAGGDANQNALIPVLANETYLINVSQFNPSPNGYTINFDSSTAVIFDDEPPSLEAAVLCGASNLQLKLPENVFCNETTADDFMLQGPAGSSFTITDISSQACLEGAEYDRFFNITFDPAITVPGDYTLSLPGSIEDLCNNTSLPDEQLVFTISQSDIRPPVEDLEACEGEDLILIVEDNANTFNFYLDSSLDSLLGTGNQLDVRQYVTDLDTPFLFYIAQANSECSNVATEITVIERTQDIADMSYETPICIDENTPPSLPTLSAETTPGGTFTIDNGALIDAATGEIDVNSTSSGNTYIITYTTIDPSCPVAATANVEIATLPSLSIDGLESSYCEEQGDVPLTASNTDAVFTGPGITANSNIFNPAVADTGRHEICASYIDPITSCSVQVCEMVEVFAEPIAAFVIPSDACLEGATTITTENIDTDNVTITWDFAGGNQIDGDNTNPIVQWDELGPKDVTLTLDIGGNCSNSVTQSIEILQLDIAEMNKDTTINPGQSVTLDLPASASNGSALNYIWTSNNDDLSCSNCLNPIVSPLESNTYNVTIAIPNSNCFVEATYRVNVERESFIAIPTSFTPNGDGMNDEFQIALRDFREAEMRIYSRSGNEVFNTTAPSNEAWDGTFENQKMDIGVYVYYLLVTFNNDDQRLYRGNITLIR